MIDWPSWIQAISALGIVILTGATLLVLKDYAADTKTIAKVSTSQTESSQMPFLVVVHHEGFCIQNQGFGPAINILYSGDDGGNVTVKKSIPPLGIGEARAMHYEIDRVLDRWRVFEIEYQSLSGGNYGTRVSMEDGQMRVEFTKRS
jgi:hypothetical protein